MPTEASKDYRSLPASPRVRLDDLARRYYGPLASFFRKRTRNASDVQDLVQQVFLRLAQSQDSGPLHNPDGYVFQTAANALKDHHRHVAVRERVVREAHLLQDSASGSDFSAERVVLGKEGVAVLAAALRQLPERTRDIMMLRCFEGLKHGEIAKLQGISTRAVEKHVAKALAHLDRALHDDSTRASDER